MIVTGPSFITNLMAAPGISANSFLITSCNCANIFATALRASGISGSFRRGSLGGKPNDILGKATVGKGMAIVIVIVFVFELKL